ncbi:hypothetical protein A2316_04245 [Candidatus Falkowbacteria bacterium RIFOXYB2_FULL_38_15]|uniref:Glutamyl-tRNA amidotransferase n=1 Tax=Candidatus Falkowbacteria bacterium RIFOXYA2_FULL_38_12 TaxID=1797993 RepID=A0A1F5S272_9BACT|nr:MAG: hypothetical protein A2257_03390 [Candidatus Falkowbacteria bacterium RIFOXYA2_FULL_38_12]OGF33693.1 MAG: hypothetical protein A2316_04245 [Candidatus Falkowbacteria bacterium RIFOXYB2_FULL_38_15]OGF42053.1 MAG: hypothetical protein A2555_01505 [Candidatus Falkowbacteria bacterium RIFOXYD2_FULL_39_16]
MSIKEKIEKDFIEARKEKNETMVSVLGMLKAAILNGEIAARPARQASQPHACISGQDAGVAGGPKEFGEDDILKVIGSEVKKHKDSIGEYTKGGREDLALKEKQEMEILMKYLPAQMTEEELKKIVEDKIKDLDAKGAGDFGKVMGAVVKIVAGRAGGDTMSKIVKEILGA